MKEYFDKFISSAQNYSRNPLGIIALFISFVYGIAALVLGLASGALEYSLKAPLVWFLIIFPLIVLMVFSDLVMNHHKKLYGPMDFRDDNSFLKTILDSISLEEKKEQIISEFQETNLEMKSILPISNDELIQKALLSEELFVKFFSNLFDVKFERNVRFRSLEGITEFDALGIKKEQLIVIEVKYTRDGKISDSVIAKQITRFMSVYSNLSKFPNVKSLTTVIGIIKEDNINYQIFDRERREKLFSKLPYSITIVEYTVSELNKIFK